VMAVTINVKHHRAGHITEPATLSWHHEHNVRNRMPSQDNINLSYEEGRIELALHAYTLRQFQTLRRAAAAFGVRH